jgi:hypothetical protein
MQGEAYGGVGGEGKGLTHLGSETHSESLTKRCEAYIDGVEVVWWPDEPVWWRMRGYGV